MLPGDERWAGVDRVAVSASCECGQVFIALASTVGSARRVIRGKFTRHTDLGCRDITVTGDST